MFYYLEGLVAETGLNLAVIDINGAGYGCKVTLNTLSRLEKGKKARLFTFCYIREDAFDIYGFIDLSEKRCFEHLLSVSGVGPKAALSILSSITPESLALAVISNDETALTVAQGVGKKLAQRIILELKDKVDKQGADPVRIPSRDAAGAGSPADGDSPGVKQRDAAAALAVLGYSPGEISAAMRSVDVSALSVVEIIRAVLKGSAK
jgi:Holliday junction DNA helicase RuvA